MNRFVLAWASLALLATPACASDVWNVVEGIQGATKGTWNVDVDGDKISGAARMAGAHGGVTYRVTGQLQKGVYMFRRVAASDHIDCTYQGAMKSDGSIVGSAGCGGQSVPWIAHPAKK